jgi:hypothetical protein
MMTRANCWVWRYRLLDRSFRSGSADIKCFVKALTDNHPVQQCVQASNQTSGRSPTFAKSFFFLTTHPDLVRVTARSGSFFFSFFFFKSFFFFNQFS